MQKIYAFAVLAIFAVAHADTTVRHKTTSRSNKNTKNTRKDTKLTKSTKASAATPSKKQAASTPSTNAKTTTASVHCVNNIAEKNLGYRKFGTHYPTTFEITVNGTKIEPDCGKEIALVKDTIVIRYHCEFKNGKYVSSKEYTYKIKPSTKKVAIDFNWKSDPRIMLDQNTATLVSTKTIEKKR